MATMRRIAPTLLCGLLAPLAQAMPVSCMVGDNVATVSRSDPIADAPSTAFGRVEQRTSQMPCPMPAATN
jgi:hypothetical protein